jgi:hypothetical protein
MKYTTGRTSTILPELKITYQEMRYYIGPKYGITENNFRITAGQLVIKIMKGKKMFLND